MYSTPTCALKYMFTGFEFTLYKRGARADWSQTCASVTTICICRNEQRQKQIRKRGKWSSRGQGWEKERTAWKGGKQFHANKGWTIGELSVSPPPCRSVSLPLRVRAELFDRDKAERAGFFFADYWMLFDAFPKGWSYSEKGFLFLWCSSIIHRPFYGLVSALEGLPKPGCIWIISL